MNRDDIMNLLQSEVATTKIYYEEFVDEDTNEFVLIKREELIEEKPVNDLSTDERVKLAKELIVSLRQDLDRFYEDNDSLKLYINAIDAEIRVNSDYKDVAQQYIDILEQYAKSDCDDFFPSYEPLGDLYKYGNEALGVSPDFEKAHECYEKALKSKFCDEIIAARIAKKNCK